MYGPFGCVPKDPERGKKMAAVSDKKKKADTKGKNAVTKLDQDEYMMAQIDRFRDKAKELQEKLHDREEELERLEALVEEKDQKVKELERLEEARRQEHEQFLESADRQFRDMVYRVEGRVNVLAREIEEKVASDEKLSEDQTVKLQWEIKQIDRNLDKIKSDLSDKTHQEMLTTYRNMHISLEEMQQHLEETIEGAKLETTQAAHDSRVDDSVLRKIRRPAVAAMVFSLLSFLTMAAYVLVDSGIIGFTFF